MKPPAFSNKATLALGINFPLLAEKLYTNTDVILWMVIRVSYLNVQWINIDRNPLCHVTSKQIPVGRELPLCWVGEKKKNVHTLSLHGAKIPCQKSPLQKTQDTRGFSHVFEHAAPPPGKSSWQSHLNKDQRKTEVGHETESRHSQNLAFPWINWGSKKKKKKERKESFSKSLK